MADIGRFINGRISETTGMVMVLAEYLEYTHSIFNSCMLCPSTKDEGGKQLGFDCQNIPFDVGKITFFQFKRADPKVKDRYSFHIDIHQMWQLAALDQKYNEEYKRLSPNFSDHLDVVFYALPPFKTNQELMDYRKFDWYGGEDVRSTWYFKRKKFYNSKGIQSRPFHILFNTWFIPISEICSKITTKSGTATISVQVNHESPLSVYDESPLATLNITYDEESVEYVKCSMPCWRKGFAEASVSSERISKKIDISKIIYADELVDRIMECTAGYKFLKNSNQNLEINLPDDTDYLSAIVSEL